MKNDGITPFFLFSLGTHLTMEKGTRLFIHGPEGGWGNLTLSSRWIQVTGTGEDSLKLGRKSKRQAPSKANANANYANATKAQAQANAKCKHKHKRVNSQSFPWAVSLGLFPLDVAEYHGVARDKLTPSW